MLTQATITFLFSRQNLLVGVAPAGTIDMIGAFMPFARNAEIYGENDRVEYLYRVLKGSVLAPARCFGTVSPPDCRLLSAG